MIVPYTPPTPHIWSTLSVIMNCSAAVLLVVGYVAVKKKRITQHRRAMTGVLICSALFLVAYLYGHATQGSTLYPVHDWSYKLYLLILIPHTILAMLIWPFIARGLWLILRKQDNAAHARLMRRVWPVWIYISITGILVYFMLYIFPHMR